MSGKYYQTIGNIFYDNSASGLASTDLQSAVDELSAGAVGFVNRVTVGTKGKYKTLKEAVDWFNASATANTEIILDAGQHNVADTITINNATYTLSIKGVSMIGTILKPVTGLANKPMFIVQSTCEITRIGADGSLLASYGTLAGENFVNLTTIGDNFFFLYNADISTFHKGVVDTAGNQILAADFLFRHMTVGFEINHSNANQEYTELNRGTIEDCDTGINLLAAPLDGFIIDNVVFDNSIGDNCIAYDGTNYIYGDFSKIVNCNFNNVGTFSTGFDFTDVRDANIIISGNSNVADNHPRGGLRVEGNTDTTTCTLAGTYYKADLGTASSISTPVFSGTGLDDMTIDVTAAYVGTLVKNIVVQIDGTPGGLDPDTFKWSNDGGTTWEVETVAITGAAQTLEEGIIIVFAAVDGHTTTENWSFTATPFTFSSRLRKFTVVGKGLKYQPDLVSDIKLNVTANVTASGTNRNVRLALVKNEVTATPMSYFKVRLVTAGEPYSINLLGCCEATAKDDIFELYVMCENAAGVTVTVTDTVIRLEQ